MGLWIILGAINAFLAVVLGAMGAHAFKLTDETLKTFQTANQYHMWHALGLLLIAALAGKLPAWGVTTSGWLIFGGMVLFSGTLYVLSITGARAPIPLAPVGGIALMAGWIVLAVAAVMAR